jgi:hypothetical protein
MERMQKRYEGKEKKTKKGKRKTGKMRIWARIVWLFLIAFWEKENIGAGT